MHNSKASVNKYVQELIMQEKEIAIRFDNAIGFIN